MRKIVALGPPCGSHMAESMDVVHYIDGKHGQPIVTTVTEDSPIKLWHDTAWGPTR